LATKDTAFLFLVRDSVIVIHYPIDSYLNPHRSRILVSY